MHLLMAVMAALITYGSLFPFDYVPHAPAWGDLARLVVSWPARLSAIDVVGNVVLFVPYGLLIPALSVRRARLAWALFGLALAWGLQYLQFWFPSRVPSGSDAWFNSLGLVAGFGLGRGLRAWTEAQLARYPSLVAVGWPVPAALLAAWVLYRWFPLVPSLDWQNLKNGVKPLLLHPSWDAVRTLHDATAWLLWFSIAHVAARRGPPSGPWRLLGGGGVWLAALVIVAAEPLFEGNAVSLANVVGLLLALACAPRLVRGAGRGGALVAAGVGVSLAVSGLAPGIDRGFFHPFHWMPFAGMLNGSMVVNTAALVEKGFLFGGVIYLLGSLGWPAPLAGLALGVELAVIEGLQCWVPGHTPEITDPLLALLFGALLTVVSGPGPGRGTPLRTASGAGLAEHGAP